MVSLVGNNFIGLVAGALEHLFNQLFGGGYYRKTVRISADWRIIIKLRYIFSLLEEFLGFLQGPLEDVPGIRYVPLRGILFLFRQWPYQSIKQVIYPAIDVLRSRDMTRTPDTSYVWNAIQNTGLSPDFVLVFKNDEDARDSLFLNR